MHYLVIDARFPSPVHVFLERDPRGEAGFPGLTVRCVTLDPGGAEAGWSGAPQAVGQDPRLGSHYREFGSDRAAEAAGYGLVEPRFVGASWASYHRAFGFGLRTLPRHG